MKSLTAFKIRLRTFTFMISKFWKYIFYDKCVVKKRLSIILVFFNYFITYFVNHKSSWNSLQYSFQYTIAVFLYNY